MCLCSGGRPKANSRPLQPRAPHLPSPNPNPTPSCQHASMPQSVSSTRCALARSRGARERWSRRSAIRPSPSLWGSRISCLGGRPRLMRPASGARFHGQRRAADTRLVVSGLSTGLVTSRGLAAMAIARLAPLSDLGPLAPRSPPRRQRGQHHPCSAASGCLVPVPKLSWRLQPPGSPPAYPARPRSGVPRRRLCATMPRPHGPSVARRPRESVPIRRMGTILVNRSP